MTVRKALAVALLVSLALIGIARAIALTPLDVATVTTGGTAAATAGSPFKAAMAYDAAGSRIVLNGGAPGSAGVPAGGMPVGLTTLRFAQVAGGVPTLDGYIRHARYWPRALTNVELQQVTT